MTTAPLQTLHEQQQALVSALFASPGDAAAHQRLNPQLDTRSSQHRRGLQAYQANGHALAERALRAAYPVVDMMVGRGNFDALARDFWHSQPPERGEVAQWGGALPAFLRASAPLADAPYLGDVAQAEWALHRAAFAANVAPDPSSFARLTAEDPTTLSLTLAPGVSTLASRFPVASLILAHLHSKPSLSDAAQRLREGQAEIAMIWRQGFKPCLAPCSPTAAALLWGLQSGLDLASALDAALAAEPADAESFDFSQWLTEAVTQGLVVAVHTARPEPVNAPQPLQEPSP